MLDFFSLFVRGLAAEFLICCLVFASYVLAQKSARGGSIGERYCALYVCACWLLTVAFHVLILSGQFKLIGALILAVVGGLMTWYWGASPQEVLRSIVSDLAQLRAVLAHTWRSPLAIAIAPFVVFALLVLGRSIFLPLLGWDSLTYHGLLAGLWVQDGGPITYDAPGGWEYYRYVFPGGEVFTAWAMLLFHSDLAACLPDYVHWLFLGVIVYRLAIEFGMSRRMAVPVACFLLWVPSRSNSIGSGYVETVLDAQLFASVLFFLRLVRTRAIGYLVLVCAAMGLAVHIKPMALAWIGLLGIAFLTWLIAQRVWRLLHWRTSFCCAVAFVGSLGPTWVSNLVTCGYPLGSTPITIGPLRLGYMAPNMAWMIDDLSSRVKPYDWRSERVALATMFKPLTISSAVECLKEGPTKFGCELKLTVSSVVTCLVGLIALGVLARNQFWPVVLVCIGVVATCVNIYNPSFSVVRLQWAGSCDRFFLPGVTLVTILGAALVARRRVPAIVYCVFLLGSGYWFLVGYVAHYLLVAPLAELVLMHVAALALLFAAAAMFFVLPKIPGRDGTLWTAIAVVSLLLACIVPFVQQGRDWLRIPAYVHSRVLGEFQRDWVPALPKLDSEPGDKRIAVTAGILSEAHNWFIYPFLGSRLENHICYVSPTKDGKVVPYHPRYLSHAIPEYDAWLSRLRDRGVTHVLSEASATVELAFMEEHPRQFTRLAGNPTLGYMAWGLYRLERQANQ